MAICLTMLKSRIPMRLLFVLALAGIFSATSWCAPPTAQSAKKKAAPKASSSKAKGTKTAKPSRGSTAKRRRRSRSPRWTFQAHPEPARYAEIQRALAERGYFKGEVNGEWKDDSVDALKRFQADQKLPDDGRIGALSLTALGLGPRHDGATASTVPAPAPAAPAAPESPDKTATPPSTR